MTREEKTQKAMEDRIRVAVTQKFPSNYNSNNEIQLNEDQLRALEEIKNFLKSSEITYTLVGAAGTGKTTLLKHIIKGLSRVSISAPTHKAKNIAAQMSGVKDSFTLAELLGLNPDVDVADFDPSNMLFAQKREPKMSKFYVNIIDEASMVNKDLYELIVKTATDCGTQVIFTGDLCQLPPVKDEGISPALSNNKQSELHKIVRQDTENPLTYLLASIRYMQELVVTEFNDTKERFEEIFDLINRYGLNLDYEETFEKRRDLFYYILNKKPSHIIDGKGFAIINDKEIFYNKAHKSLDDGGRLLAFTNKAVKACNTMLRSISGRSDNLVDQLQPGEIITGYKTLRDANNNAFLINSMDYRISNKKASISSYGLQVIRVEAVDLFYGNRTFIDILHPEEWNKFSELYHNALAEAKGNKNKWVSFFQFQDAHALTSFNNFSPVIKNSLEYGYAMTIHKSQGSTFKHVFVRVDDINRYAHDKLFNLKLLYVALSRATDIAVMNF